MNQTANATGHAFLSYDPDDASQVNRLQRALENAGISVWRDTDDLWPGADWRYEMRKAIAGNALVFIACFSLNSLGRAKSVQNEQFVLAVDQLRLRPPGDGWLVLARLDECIIPDWDLGGGRTLGSLVKADLAGDRFDAGAASLIARLKRLLGPAGSAGSEVLAPASGTSARDGAKRHPAAGVAPVTFEIAIDPVGGGGKFKSEVLHSEAGEGSVIFELDLEALSLRCAALDTAVPASAERGAGSPAARSIREVGEELFAALLGAEPVGGIYRSNVSLAADQDRPLQVVLRAEAPGLANLPWEAIYDPVRGAYLVRRNELIRNIPIATVAAPLLVRPPLRILGIASSPADLPPVSLERERRLLGEALAEPVREGLVEIEWAPAGTWNAVLDLMLAGGWHAIHFVGHSGFDTGRGEGTLLLTRDNGQAHPVEASQFADLLSQARPAPRLVVLNSCDGGAGATATALIRGGASAVAAMRYQVTDLAAVAFARAFYGAIARGRGVDEAVSSGRIGILGTGSDTLEWITPVLYLRNNQARLFDRRA